MSIRPRRWADGAGLARGWNAGVVKVSILLSLAAFFLFLILTMGVQKSTAVDCDCNFCHGDTVHGPGWQGCATCHGNPPATASHVRHFGLNTQYERYGDTSITKDFTSGPYYAMSCGNCHPMDPAKHRNGTVEVELYNAAAPAGSLKARNLPSAVYTPGGTVYYDANGLPYTLGTCSNVYCHSYNEWTTTGPVPDQGCDNSVPSTLLVTTRHYKTPTWGGSLSCSGCHNNPPTTAWPDNDGGIGDSHQWIDDWGYGNLHMFNHGFDPIGCIYCHNDTVRELNYTWTRDDMDVTSMGDVPIHDYSKHINGTADVAFDRVNTFPYPFNPPYSLSNASYDPSARTCANVSCHQNETVAKWGAPYNYYGWQSGECDRCHWKGFCGN